MLREIRRLLRLRRNRRQNDNDHAVLDSGFKSAMHKHLASTRLVRIQAARSAKALKRLSEVLAIRAKAIDSIAAAEDALAVLGRDDRHDK